MECFFIDTCQNNVVINTFSYQRLGSVQSKGLVERGVSLQLINTVS